MSSRVYITHTPLYFAEKDLHALRDNTSPIIRPKSPGAFFFLGARSVVIEQLLHRVKIHSLKNCGGGRV